MVTKWSNVEVTNEKVVDTNPKVWLSATRTSLSIEHYGEALQNIEQAITFSKIIDTNLESWLKDARNNLKNKNYSAFSANVQRILVFLEERIPQPEIVQKPRKTYGLLDRLESWNTRMSARSKAVRLISDGKITAKGADALRKGCNPIDVMANEILEGKKLIFVNE